MSKRREMDPFATVSMRQCYSDPDANSGCSDLGSVQAQGDGTVVADVIVSRYAADDEGGGDCWFADATCTVKVHDGVHGLSARLAFDPTTPPPPAPIVNLSASVGLAADAEVLAYGSGMLSRGFVAFEQCRPPDMARGCVDVGRGVGDGSGNFIVPIRVHRVLPGFPYDCATSPTPCVVRARTETHVIDTPITFDPTTIGVPEISMSVAPATGLVDGDVMTISASGFSPNRLVAAGFCRRSPNGLEDCTGGGPTLWGLTGPDGTVTVQVHAVSAFSTADGLVDCRVAPGACVVVIATFSEFDEVGVLPIEFAPDDDHPSVSVGDLTTTEGEGGFLTAVRVPVQLSGPAHHRVIVVLDSVDGSAHASTDYVVPVDGQSTVTIPPGETQGFVTAYAFNDDLNESTERFWLHPLAAVGADITGGDGVVTILDDDPEPLVGVGDAAAREADGVVRVPVVMTPSGRDVTVEYRTHHGSARSGTDFERTKGTVTIPAGQTLVWITVPVVDDRVRESTESFTLALRRARPAQISRAVGIVTITDDD